MAQAVYVNKNGKAVKKSKRKRIFWGIYLLITVAAIAVDVVGKNMGWLPENFFPLWKIILGLLLIYFAIETAFARLVWMLPLFVGGLFILLQHDISNMIGLGYNELAPVWVVILAAVLLAVAFGLLFPMRRKKKNVSKVRVKTDSSQFEQVYVREETTSNKFGAKTVYIDCADFTYKTVENSFGACDVRFVNTDLFCGNAELTVINNMGAVNVQVPANWTVVNMLSSSIGGVSTVTGGDPDKVLTIKGENSMGAVNVEREGEDDDDEDEREEDTAGNESENGAAAEESDAFTAEPETVEEEDFESAEGAARFDVPEAEDEIAAEESEDKTDVD